MAYILKDKIKINKPIVFLCGPFYNDKEKSDRRKILQDFLLTELRGHCLPLIIDDFLTKDNIGDESVSIQLLEEIFAGISCKTYIFLDTMSSAVELGLFTNSAYNNSICVMMPYEAERNCGTVGVFTKEAVLKDNNERVQIVYYHPRIERVAFSTDYVGEYYKFIDDQLPMALQKNILNDFENIDYEYHIKLVCKDSYPKSDYDIHYQFNTNDNSLITFLSVKLLFYIVSGILYSEYGDDLRKKDKLIFNDHNIDNAVSYLNSIILTYIMKNTKLSVNGKTRISIQTILTKDTDDLVKHIFLFIFTYHKKSRLNGYYLVGKNEIIKELDSNYSPIDFFELDSDEIDFIKDIESKKDVYFREFSLKTGYKKRKMVTYRDDDNGQAMRKFHNKIATILKKKHFFSEMSFAYQKGKSIKKCIECHKDNDSFLKFDIHKFFNSIDEKKLVRKLLKEFEFDKVYEDQILLIMETCFYDGKMPLGFITSPILSDIYMKDFDEEFMKKLGGRYIYTRYADDILISDSEPIGEAEEQRIGILLNELLSNLGLVLNEKKYLKKDLIKSGDYIKYLGINIVKTDQENRITVGKAYKNYIAKCYLKYRTMNGEDGESKYYFGKQIAGYLSFVKMIEGEEGLQKIYNRIDKSTKGRVVIRDRISNL